MWGPCKGRGVGEEDGETGFGMGEAAFVLPPQSQREEEGARKESLCSPVEGGGEEEATEEDGGDRRGRRASLRGSGRGERARMIGGGFLPFAGELRAYVRPGAGGGERTGDGLRAVGWPVDSAVLRLRCISPTSSVRP